MQMGRCWRGTKLGALALGAALALTALGSGCTEASSVEPEPEPAEDQVEHLHDDDATVHHGFEGAEEWSARFDAPERDTWQRPWEVIDFLALDESARVADLGAGTGYFTVRLAERLAPEGSVIAVDVEEEMLDFIDERARESGFTNVVTRLAAPDDPGLERGSVDLVLCVNTWHHIDGRRDYARRLRETLREGGRVVIVDYREGDLPVGPPEGHKLPEGQVQAEFEAAGYTLADAFDGLEYQYVLVFRPPDGG